MSFTEGKKRIVVEYLDNLMSSNAKNAIKVLLQKADAGDSEFTTDDLIEVLREVCATQNKSEKEGNNRGHDR